MDMVKVEALAKWIRESKNIVAFTGAGCSTESGVPDFRSPGGVFDLGTNCPITTESGIPDFRSVDGLYHQQYAFPPETILSHSFFERNPEEFYRFYRSKMLFPQARPNAAHWKLEELEAAGKLTAVVTQNIDGLHQAAGSKTVYELHGSVHRNHCMKCRRFYSLDFLLETGGVPRCPACGGVVKPDVVLYEECLDETTMVGAVEAITQADMLIIGGTSLAVYPAAGLIRYYRGNRLALINKSATPYDREAGLVINASLGEVLGAVRV